MHDDYLVSYSVDLVKKYVIIQTYNNTEKRQRRIYFSEVLTHFFRCITDYNIILGIDECDIYSFVKDNQEEFKKMEDYCWSVDYNTEMELIDFLITNKYKYIKINSSYGMFGWIIAKSYEIKG